MSSYPLTTRAFAIGSFIALGVWVATSSVLSGATLLVLASIVGLTWRRGEAPVVPFVLTYQWLQVCSGYLYFKVTGIFPDIYDPGDLDLAVTLGLIGLTLLAAGVRLVSELAKRHEGPSGAPLQVDDLRGLLIFVLALYSVDYVRTVTVSTGGTFSVIIDRLLQLRQIPLLLLWMEVVRQNRRRSYLWISLAWVLVPQLGSYYSDFKTSLILLVIVSALYWEPWNMRRDEITFHGFARVAWALVAGVFLAMLWQAGVKRDIRRAVDVEGVGSNPVQRVQLFVDRAKVALPTVLDDPQSVVEGLVSRVSYVTFFSRVLEHVPSREPFADGELLKMTFSNAFMPRFLFPDKGALPSDSYYTRRFAGVFVMEDNTSISIGYMAEFYADWGMTGMLISTFCYGLLLGVAVWIIRAQTPRLLTNPALIVTMLSVLPFEHQFIKGFATLILSVVLAVVVTRLVEPLMIRHLHVRRLLTGSGGRAQSQSRANMRPTLRPMPHVRRPAEP